MLRSITFEGAMIKHLRRMGSVVVLTALLGFGAAGCAALGSAPSRLPADESYRAGAYEQAVQRYRAYLDMRPGDPYAWFRLGNAQAALGNLDAARESLETALALKPDLAHAEHNLGLVHMELAWRHIVAARSELPASDARARSTMRYLGCLMQVMSGAPDPELCQSPLADKEAQ